MKPSLIKYPVVLPGHKLMLSSRVHTHQLTNNGTHQLLTQPISYHASIASFAFLQVSVLKFTSIAAFQPLGCFHTKSGAAGKMPSFAF